MRAIDATTFRVGDIFAWHPRVEPSRGRSATVQPWAGLSNPFRILVTGFKSGVNRSLVQGPEPNDTAAPPQFQFNLRFAPNGA